MNRPAARKPGRTGKPGDYLYCSRYAVADISGEKEAEGLQINL